MLARLNHRRVRLFVSNILYLPLLVFTLFSGNIMLEETQQGFAVVICTGEGVETVYLDENGNEQKATNHTICEWSLNLPEADIAPDVHYERVTYIQLDREYYVTHEVIEQETFVNVRLARAPPVA